MDTLWTFKTRNFTVKLCCMPESDPDLSWDESGETQRKVASGEWDCVTFAVLVDDADGNLIGSDYLGNSVYENVGDFRKEHIGARGEYGSYFPGMVAEAIREARETMRSRVPVYIRENA